MHSRQRGTFLSDYGTTYSWGSICEPLRAGNLITAGSNASIIGPMGDLVLFFAIAGILDDTSLKYRPVFYLNSCMILSQGVSNYRHWPYVTDSNFHAYFE